MKELPIDRHITYQLRYRTCGKQACRVCREGGKHGPYWYGYWKDERRKVCSAYIGKVSEQELMQRIEGKKEAA